MSRLTTADADLNISDDEATGERARRTVSQDELCDMYRGIDWLTPKVLDRVLTDLSQPDHFDRINALEDRGSLMSDAEPLD